MKKPFKVLSAAAMAAVVVVPSIVVPVQAAAATPAAATTPDQLVFTNDAGQQFLVSYEDYADFLFGEGNFVGVLEGKAPSAIGIDGKYVDYKKFQDILFEEGNAGLPTSDLLDKAVKDESNLVDKETSDSYVDVTFDKDGKPVYGEPEPTEVEVALEKATTAVTALPNVDDVKATDEAAVTAAAKLVADAKALGADVTALEAKVTALQAKIDEINAVVTLNVESVSAINKQGVTVKFPALTKAMTDVEVTVKDDKGNTVEVKSIPVLDVGETTATFTFKNALTTEPTGSWTVNGVSFDANAQTAVTKVNTATNQVELLAALKSSYFTKVTDAKITDYFAEMNGKTYETVADVQKAIEKANIASESTKLVSDIVDAMAANNEVTLLSLLKSPSFEGVNSDLITKYMAEFKGNVNTATTITAASSVVNVQAEIDAVNKAEATAAVVAAADNAPTALTTEALNKAQALVTALPEETVSENADKKGLQDRLNKAVAVSKVKNATTQASLLAALKSPVLQLQNIDDALVKFYKTAQGSAVITNSAAPLQADIITAGKGLAVTDLGKKVSEITAETSLADVKSLLTELKRLDGGVFTEKINDSLLEEYRAALVAVTPKSSKNTTTLINGIIAPENSTVSAFSSLNTAATGSDAAALLTALKAKTLNLSNVKDANSAAYLADKVLFQTAQAGTVEEAQAAVNVVNAVAEANAASTAQQMRDALTKHSANLATPNNDYLNLSAQAKLEVAELVLAEKTKNGNFANSAAVTSTLGATKAAGQLKVHDDILTAVNALDADSTITVIDTALQEVDYAAYNDLGISERLAIAEAFKANLPVDKDGVALPVNYKTLSAIIADIKAATEGKTTTPPTATTVSVKDVAELNAALTNKNVRNISLSANMGAGETFTANHLVNVSLNGKTLTGNLVFAEPNERGTVKLSNGTLDGNLTVNTPFASFANSATVTGSTIITNVAPGTFTNTGTLAAVTIADADGTRFVNRGTAGVVDINTTGAVTLEGTYTNEVKLSQAATVTIPTGSTVPALNVTSNASSATVTNNGSVGEIKGDGSAGVVVNGTGSSVVEVTNNSFAVAKSGTTLTMTGTKLADQVNDFGELTSYEVSFQKSSGDEITKFTLNELGLFQFGNDKYSFAENGTYTKEITSGNVGIYNALIPSSVAYADILSSKAEGNIEETLQVGDIINIPADGKVKTLAAVAVTPRVSDYKGMEATVKSVWDKSAYDGSKVGEITQAVVTYKSKAGVTYKQTVSVN